MLLSGAGAGSGSREPEPEPGQSWTSSTTLVKMTLEKSQLPVNVLSKVQIKQI